MSGRASRTRRLLDDTRVAGIAMLVVAAVLVSPRLPGRWRGLRLLTLAVVWVVVEWLGVLAAFVLWVASGFGWKLRTPVFQQAHYAVLRGLLAELVATATWVFHLQLDTDGVSWSPVDDGVPGSTNAMVVLSRHAGPGDSLLLVRTLMDRDHLRRVAGLARRVEERLQQRAGSGDQHHDPRRIRNLHPVGGARRRGQTGAPVHDRGRRYGPA